MAALCVQHGRDELIRTGCAPGTVPDPPPYNTIPHPNPTKLTKQPKITQSRSNFGITDTSIWIMIDVGNYADTEKEIHDLILASTYTLPNNKADSNRRLSISGPFRSFCDVYFNPLSRYRRVNKTKNQIEQLIEEHKENLIEFFEKYKADVTEYLKENGGDYSKTTHLGILAALRHYQDLRGIEGVEKMVELLRNIGKLPTSHPFARLKDQLRKAKAVRGSSLYCIHYAMLQAFNHIEQQEASHEQEPKSRNFKTISSTMYKEWASSVPVGITSYVWKLKPSKNESATLTAGSDMWV